MADVNDDTDFNKARAFLLTYSAVVLALWFFGADLTSFKLMGTDISLKHRTNSIWIVLACLNIYFWFRCYQRLPEHALRFDEGMHKTLDTTLASLGKFLHRKDVMKWIEEMILAYGSSSTPTKLLRFDINVNFPYRDELEKINEKPVSIAKTPSSYSFPFRAKMYFKVTTFTNKGEGVLPEYYEVLLSKRQYLIATIYSFAKGIFIRSWFTDHIAPFVFAGVSTATALWKWWDVNCLATS